MTFCLSSLNSSLGRVPERSWERHSIRSHISLWTCFTRLSLLAWTGGCVVLSSDMRKWTSTKRCFSLLLFFYHKELLPYASPLPQCGGHLLDQGHLCRHHYLLVSVVARTRQKKTSEDNVTLRQVKTFLMHSPLLFNDDLFKMNETGRKHSLERNVHEGDQGKGL